MTSFQKRVFGCAIIKSINSNYNADFSHQPRTLPNGVVYATDKALKYAIRNYIKKSSNQKVLYFKTLNSDATPMSLEQAYEHHFGKDKSKQTALKNLLSCVDVRLFGATLAMKGKDDNLALSLHGTVQINHGVNIWKENNIYSEQIMAPFQNKEKDAENKDATTLGRQSKLQEGHYLHHFSINPKNLEEISKLVGADASVLNQEDIDLLKESLRKGVTYYDSAAKAGTDNEFLLWIQLKENSKAVLPNCSDLIQLDKTDDGKVIIDMSGVRAVCERNQQEIESVEIYLLPESVVLKNTPHGALIFDLTTASTL